MSLYVDIEKRYGDFLLRVKFETEREVFAILGASGCGKSLTLKCIAGIEKPDRGIIRLDDNIFFDSERRINIPARRRNVGYLFQDFALFPNMTVFQNIMCGAKNQEKARDFVKRFYLDGKENLYPSQLSGGQKQRTAIARMLSAKPDIIMLDEPFSALDNYLKTQLEREVMNVLDSFDKTVLFVSHDRNEVYRLTDTIAVMDEGKVVDIQPKKELFQSPKTLAATLLTGCKNVTRLEVGQSGVITALDWGLCLQGAPEMETSGIEASEVETPEIEARKTRRSAAGNRWRYAAFRAHYFEVVSGMEDANVLECEILRVIEDTFSVIVLFRNKGCTEEGDYAILTYELPKEAWEQIKGGRIFLKIPSDKLMFMEK